MCLIQFLPNSLNYTAGFSYMLRHYLHDIEYLSIFSAFAHLGTAIVYLNREAMINMCIYVFSVRSFFFFFFLK